MDTASVRRRLWARTTVDEITGCWVWTGRLNHSGYGKINIDKVTYQVHRLAYTLMAAPFDHELTLDHLCRNRACWNPAHLEPCPLRVNILRGDGPPAENSRKTHCIHGHELTPDNVRKRTGARAHHRECLTCWRRQKAERKRLSPV